MAARHGQEERQQGEPGVVPGGVEIAVEKALRQRPQAAVAEVHQREGDVVEGVDRGERRVELETVEQDRAAIPEHDVAEMEIAVAMADLARMAPLLEQIAAPLELGARAPFRSSTAVAAKTVAGQSRQVLGIAVDDLPHGGMAAALGPLLGLVVKAGDRLGQRVDRRAVEFAALGDPVEQRRLIEAPHLEQPFDRLPGALQGVAAICRRVTGIRRR